MPRPISREINSRADLLPTEEKGGAVFTSETFGRKDLRRKCWTGGRTATMLAGRGACEWARGIGFGPGLDVCYPSTPAPRALLTSF